MSSFASTLNNRYRLDKSIGEGGFAKVFLATDLDLGRQVAVKILDQSWARDKELLARFRIEARAIASLDHPNILQIYDFGVAKGAPYLVMPFISGGTLAARMKQGPFTLDEVGTYLNQIGSALDYAHQHGVVHRDVKPTNLLMRPNGQLVLMDFGLAKLLENVELAEQTAIVGTVAYMAPEQCQGMVSSASDIYMLGVLLYQMLAGKIPFEGNTTQIMVGHVYAAPGSLIGLPTMRLFPPTVVQALDQVLTKVLAKQPADRYPNCIALSNAYYKAIKVDENRASKDYKHDKSPKKVDFSETLLTNQPLIVPVTPTPMEPARAVEVKAVPEVDLDATQRAPSPLPRKKVMLKPPRLVVTTMPDKYFQATFDLTGETLTLGRATDNNLCLPLAIISRYHAVFSRLNSESLEQTYKIIQRKSINSLLFKGKEVHEKVLEHGDTIEIGKREYAEYIVKLTYQAPEFGFV